MTATESRDALIYLRAAQNRDGGWGFRGGADSWTEPTAFALLALAGPDTTEDACRRGRAWLLRSQRRDGGWAPHPSVDMSTWVTAPVLCVLAKDPSGTVYRRALEWLLQAHGEEWGLVQRLRGMLLGQHSDGDGATGWPWSPRTAGWVMPTCFSLFALRTAAKGDAVRSRQEQGRRFLLARTCSDGGWNYGTPRVLGYDSGSYSETTGAALAALQGTDSPHIAKALDCAGRLLVECRSAQGAAWLRMGMAAHGRKALPPQPIKCRTVLDFALTALAGQVETGLPALGVSHART